MCRPEKMKVSKKAKKAAAAKMASEPVEQGPDDEAQAAAQALAAKKTAKRAKKAAAAAAAAAVDAARIAAEAESALADAERALAETRAVKRKRQTDVAPAIESANSVEPTTRKVVGMEDTELQVNAPRTKKKSKKTKKTTAAAATASDVTCTTESSTPAPKKKKAKVAVEQDSFASTSVAAVRESMQLRIEEDPLGDCPAPLATFAEMDQLPRYVFENLKRHNIARPMPIQAQAVPLVLAGRDVIGLAQTGSGKTLAFLLPLAAKLETKQYAETLAKGSPIALVLVPTRELAVQISNEADKIFEQSRSAAHPSGIHTACLYGGGDKKWQSDRLRRGAHLVAATPGRLMDFMESGVADLSRVSYFVLDEADRMLDMGFQDDVTSIAGRVQQKRQVLFFSATWGSAVQELAQGLCRKGSRPVRISYGQGGASEGGNGSSEDAHRQAREGITQEVVVLDHNGGDGEQRWETQAAEKMKFLEEHLSGLLKASQDNKVLVFVSQKKVADDLSGMLQKQGFAADAMHGGKAQEYRLWVLDEFRKSKLRVLVATDVLGRGIDIPDVSHVVIHEMGEIEDYVHRIGRTARGRNAKGHALVFFEYWEGAPQLAADLVGVLTASKQPVPAALTKIADEVAQGKRKIRQDLLRKKW